MTASRTRTPAFLVIVACAALALADERQVLRTFDTVAEPALGPVDVGTDFDDDGTPDVLAMLFDGTVRVYSGADGMTLRDIPTTDSPSPYGNNVQFIGDLNGDGMPDVLAADVGTARLGDPPGFVAAFSGATGAELYRAPGTQSQTRFGASLAILGDVTGDGVPDFVAGGGGSTNTNPGEIRGFSGADGSVIPDLERMGTATDNLGASMVALGDVNGDGKGDFAVSLPGADKPPSGSPRGRVEIVSGADGDILRTLRPPSGVTSFGTFIGNAGDLDQDGRQDVAVRAFQLDTVLVHSSKTGKVIRAFKAPFDVGVEFGDGITGGVDVNGDGVTDVAIAYGEYQASSVFVYSGAPTKDPLLARIDGTATETFGYQLRFVPDANSDGVPDILTAMDGGGIHVLALVPSLPLKFAFALSLVRTEAFLATDATGTVSLKVTPTGSTFTVTCANLPPAGGYTLHLEDGAGTGSFMQVGAFTVSSRGATLVLTGTTAPPAALGITSYAQLAGRRVQVRADGESTVLDSRVPIPGPKTPFKKKVKLLRAPGPAAAKAKGKALLSYVPGNGASRIDIVTRGILASPVPQLLIEDAPGSGVFVAGGAFTGRKYTRDAARGQPLPGGADSVVDLRGRAIRVMSGADLMLSGTLP